MGNWYVRVNDASRGPFTSAQLRAFAQQGKVVPDTLVRRGSQSEWFAAGQIAGLFDRRSRPESHAAGAEPAAAESHARAGGAVVAEPRTEERAATGASPSDDLLLVPRYRPAVRFPIALGIVLLLSIGSSPWYAKAFVSGLALLSIGTFSQTVLRQGEMVCTYVVAFLPVHRRRWKLERFVQILTGLEEDASLLEVLLIGYQIWFLQYVVRFLFPWFGGSYKLWLDPARGDRVLAWQGNREEDFRRNLKMLEAATGLNVVRG